MSDPFYSTPFRAVRGGGFIYIVAFDNPARTVKVGASTTPRERLMVHANDADMFGHKPIDWWVSQEHLNTRDTELALMEHARSLSTGRSRREYFHGVDFKALEDLAVMMPIQALPKVAGEQPNSYFDLYIDRIARREQWLATEVPAGDLA